MAPRLRPRTPRATVRLDRQLGGAPAFEVAPSTERITEAGAARITEAGQVRVTEGP